MLRPYKTPDLDAHMRMHGYRASVVFSTTQHIDISQQPKQGSLMQQCGYFCLQGAAHVQACMDLVQLTNLPVCVECGMRHKSAAAAQAQDDSMRQKLQRARLTGAVLTSGCVKYRTCMTNLVLLHLQYYISYLGWSLG